MKFLILICFLFLFSGFNFKMEIKQWELREENITAEKLNTRKELLKLNELCEKEQLTQQFPYSCLSLSPLLGRLRLVKNEDHKVIISKLCIMNLENLSSLTVLQQIKNKAKEFKSCFKGIEQREKILKYKKQL